MFSLTKDGIDMLAFDDMHCHFRWENLLYAVLSQTIRYAERAIAMPNLRPRAILTAKDVIWYRDEIRRAVDKMSDHYSFEPLMTIEIRDNTTPKMISMARMAGAVAGKVYPLGVTTNSDEGLRDFFSEKIFDTFRAMQDAGMLLLFHGELSGKKTLVTKREEFFLDILEKIANKFPELKIVLEHISTKEAINMVAVLGDNIAATITAHHLFLTLNDVIGDGIRPHNACNPMPKGFDDRDALIAAATGGNPKFFFGSDSAPHLRKNKECAKGACGIYSAPVVPAILVEVFDSAGCLHNLENFTSRFGADFYGLPVNKRNITLVRKGWTVPKMMDGVVPFRAGDNLQWSLAEK
jgi:dihydroorotase